MDSHEEDYQYWISRRVKILEEFQELRYIRNFKKEELEEQKRLKQDCADQIAELKERIEGLRLQIKENTRFEVRPRDYSLNVTAPVISPKSMILERQFTKEFDQSIPKDDFLKEQPTEKIYEYFFLIGSQHGSEPQTLCTLPENNSFADSARGRVLGNFAFPFKPQSKIVKQKRIIHELWKIYNTELTRDGKHFVFSVKSDIESLPPKHIERANYKSEVLYCCCVVLEELIDFLDGNYLIQPRCYCLLSYYPCFELLFEILFWAVGKKISAEKKLIQKQLNDKDDEYSLQGSLQKILNGDHLEHTKKALLAFQDKTVEVTSIKVEDFFYQFNPSHKELDIGWFCPVLFSLIDFEDFWYLLTSILQEASVIFISQNLDYLTSCVLGFQGLIRPYSWPHVLTPILPDSLHDILDAPVPLLAGIPVNPETPRRRMPAHLILVDLDTKNIKQRLQKPLASSQKLSRPKAEPPDLKKSYENFCKSYQSKNKKRQGEFCQKIFTIIRRFIQNLFKFPEIIASANSNLLEVDDYIQQLTELGEEDIEFKNNFYNTQMCINYIEEYHFHMTSKAKSV